MAFGIREEERIEKDGLGKRSISAVSQSRSLFCMRWRKLGAIYA